MTVYEPIRAATWLYSRLEPDATLRTALGGSGRVFNATVPQGSTHTKYVVFQLLSLVPTVCQGPTRPAAELVYSIKAVGVALPFSALYAALDRIEALLFGVDVTATILGASWHFTVAERPDTSLGFEYVERTPGGPDYTHAGRRWPIMMQAA